MGGESSVAALNRCTASALCIWCRRLCWRSPSVFSSWRSFGRISPGKRRRRCRSTEGAQTSAGRIMWRRGERARGGKKIPCAASALIRRMLSTARCRGQVFKIVSCFRTASENFQPMGKLPPKPRVCDLPDRNSGIGPSCRVRSKVLILSHYTRDRTAFGAINATLCPAKGCRWPYANQAVY